MNGDIIGSSVWGAWCGSGESEKGDMGEERQASSEVENLGRFVDIG